MTTFATPLCMLCKHYRRNVGGLTCDAYPGGIPDVILHSQHDHRIPRVDDNGIQFELMASPPVPLDDILEDLDFEKGVGDD